MGFGAKGFRRPNRDGGGDEGDWITSYSDVVSLLFAFMAIILSVSKVDIAKMDRLSSSISGGFSKHHQESTLESVKSQLETSLVDAGFTADAKVRTSERGIEVDLSSGILFEPGSADLSKQAETVLATVSRTVHSLPVVVEVEGHTDSAPIHSARFPSNWELSGARASEVVRSLIGMGFDPARLKAVALADTRPPVGDVEYFNLPPAERMARQRRVTLILVPIAGDGKTALNEGAPEGDEGLALRP